LPKQKGNQHHMNQQKTEFSGEYADHILEKAAEPSSIPVEDYDPVILATVQKFNNEIANKDKDPCP
jgi:hypothetical protein